MVATTVAMRGPPTARPAHSERARHSADTARSLPASVPANAVPNIVAATSSNRWPPEQCSPLTDAHRGPSQTHTRHAEQVFHPTPRTKRRSHHSPPAAPGTLDGCLTAPLERVLRASAAGMAGARLRPPPPAPPGPPRYSDGYRSAVPACPQPEHIGRWSKCPTLS